LLIDDIHLFNHSKKCNANHGGEDKVDHRGNQRVNGKKLNYYYCYKYARNIKKYY